MPKSMGRAGARRLMDGKLPVLTNVPDLMPRRVRIVVVPVELNNERAAMKDFSGPIQTRIHEQSRAEQSRAEQSRAEQSRAEQSRAEQSGAEQSRAEQSQGCCRL
jgi:hypothetical protein